MSRKDVAQPNQKDNDGAHYTNSKVAKYNTSKPTPQEQTGRENQDAAERITKIANAFTHPKQNDAKDTNEANSSMKTSNARTAWHEPYGTIDRTARAEKNRPTYITPDIRFRDPDERYWLEPGN